MPQAICTGIGKGRGVGESPIQLKSPPLIWGKGALSAILNIECYHSRLLPAWAYWVICMYNISVEFKFCEKISVGSSTFLWNIVFAVAPHLFQNFPIQLMLKGGNSPIYHVFFPDPCSGWEISGENCLSFGQVVFNFYLSEAKFASPNKKSFFMPVFISVLLFAKFLVCI